MNFSQYIEDNIEEGLSGIKEANSVKIIGPDLSKLEKLADQVRAQMNHTDSGRQLKRSIEVVQDICSAIAAAAIAVI